jgi:hypothetical protein
MQILKKFNFFYYLLELGAHEKDKVGNYLHKEVYRGTISLQTACLRRQACPLTH